MALHQRNKRQSDEAQIIVSLDDPGRLPALVDFLVKHGVEGAIESELGVTQVLIAPKYAEVIRCELRKWWGDAPGLTVTGLG